MRAGMKCEKCGSNISINNKFCPNCGARNEIGAQHVDDMMMYEKRFSSTEKDVKKKSGWFIKYVTPMIILVISALFFVIVSGLSAGMYGYELADSKVENYNKKNAQEINNHIRLLLEKKEFVQAYMLYNIADQGPFSEEGKYNGWYQLYNCIESYFTVRQNIISYYSPVDYEYNSQISKAAQGINDFYDRISARDLSNADKDSIIYIEQLKNQMEDFLTAYCCFSQDDLDSLPEKDTTGIVSLLTRRMLHEE